MNVISPGAWLRSRNGHVYYAYSSTKGAGAPQETVIDIPNIGLDDLLVNLEYLVDWVSITTSAGVSVSIDGVDIFFFNGATGGGGVNVTPNPWKFQFIVPAQTALKVDAHCHAGDTGAFRAANLTATPLEVPD